jgi:hypothetical protein
MHMFIQPHSHQYPTNLAQVGLSTFWCQTGPLFGMQFCWNINHPYSTTLKHFLKSSMPPFEIWTKNSHLTSRYDLFDKDHVKLRCIRWILNNWFVLFHEVKQHS